MVVTETTIEAFDRITFVGLSERLDPRSNRMLDALAETLGGNEDLRLVEVQAFGADGAPQWQQVIGARRAQAVVDALVARGVARTRLRARGIAKPPPGHGLYPVFEIIERGP